MSKPSDIPEWNTGEANNTEPNGAKKILGFAASEKPVSSSFLNWWMNLVYKWMVWLDAFESTTHDWSAAQTFTDSRVEFYNTTAAQDRSPRWQMADPPQEEYRELMELTADTGATFAVRTYHSATGANTGVGQFVVTSNASWLGALWSKDDDTKASWIVALGPQGINIGKNPDTGSGGTSTFTDSTFFANGAAFDPDGATNGALFGKAAGAAVATFNKLNHDTATAVATFSGGWGSGTPTLQVWKDAFGVVHFSGRAVDATAAGTATEAVCTLASGYRPSRTTRVTAVYDDAGTFKPCVLLIATSGVVTVDATSLGITTANGDGVDISVTFETW